MLAQTNHRQLVNLPAIIVYSYSHKLHFHVCLCPQSLEVLLRHPEDNRNQIRELAQTLMDGGVLDELIQQKLDAFNARWDELMARVRRALKAQPSFGCTLF